MLIIANENNVFMKTFISNEMKCGENSYLLHDSTSSDDKIMFTADVSSLRVLSFTLLNENYLWILLSNGNLYEYNFCKNIFTVIEDPGQIRCYVML